MIYDETEGQDAEVPELAVKALTAAHHRAVRAGHPLVLVKNGFLVRVESSGTTVLKELPARRKVSFRIRKAKP